MKTEMRKRSLWERIKLAFRYLFSNDALLPVYQEGFEDGKATVYDDYRVVKEELAPFIKQMADTRWYGDRGIVVPGMLPHELYQVPVVMGMDVLGDCIQVADSPYPQPEHAVQMLTFRQETIQNALDVDARMAREIERWQYEAAKGLARFLVDNGYIKWQQIATTEPYKQRIVFYINGVKRC